MRSANRRRRAILQGLRTLVVLALVAAAARAGEPLLLGPVEGFTTQWCVLPGRLAFPQDRVALLRQFAPPEARVVWTGAQEIRRDARSSCARAEPPGLAFSWITAQVELPGGDSWSSRVLVEWVSLQPEDLVVGPVRVQSWKQDEEQQLPSVLEAQVRASAEAGSIVDVSTARVVGFLAAVTPAAAAPLVEWRFDGRAPPAPTPGFLRSCAGSPEEDEAPLRVADTAFLLRRFDVAGDVTVEVGPPGRAATRLLRVRDPASPPGAALVSPRRRVPSQTWLTPLFEEVTVPAGIQHAGESFGASWGFADPGPYPDLWCGNHRTPPSLYLSVGGTGFVDVAPLVVTGSAGDAHGAAFADFDRDGDEDLLELVGANFGQGSDANHFYVSTHGVLLEVAALLGLDYPEGRGRTPVWMDWNGDARLDVLVTNFQRDDGKAPTTVFQQGTGTFQSLSPQVFFGGTGHHRFAQLADLSDDSVPDVIVHGFPYPSNVFFPGDPSPVNQAANLGLPTTTFVFDAAIADFNGDLRPDLFLVRNSDVTGYRQVGTSRVELQTVVNGTEAGLGVAAGGTVTVTANPFFSVTAQDVFIGASGWHPASTSFTLDASDPSVLGAPPHVAGVDDGVYLWRDAVAGTWELRHSGSSYLALNFEVTTELPITGVSAVGFDPRKPPPTDRLLVRQGGAFVDVTTQAGLGIPVADSSVAAGDFDNDMDQDLYLVCLGPVSNEPNRYFENDGTGVFTERPAGAGAAGTSEGRGESVAVADYDVDGFLDLFVTNGYGCPPFADGPHQLFHNRGNDHHWIELRLVGTRSNLEAIGARVLATAGGVTQLREQGGGMHAWSQNLPVVHFGLGPNTHVDLSIRWPSGTLQTLIGVAADQRLTLIEP